MRRAAVKAGQELIVAAPAEASSKLKVCALQGELVDGGFVPPATSGDAGAAWVDGCTATAARARDWFLATRWAETLVREYPENRRVGRAKTSLLQFEVLRARDLDGTPVLDVWEPTGRRSAGKALVRYRNDLPYELRLVFVGPSTVEVVLPGCPDCTRDPTPESSGAPDCTGVQKQVTLVPGRYLVMFAYTIGRASVGTMQLRDHEVYERCAYDHG